MKLRKEVYEGGKRKAKSHDSHSNNNFNKKPNTGYSGKDQKQIPRCNKCGRQGHTTNECRRGSDQCYRCGKPGHLIRNCPIPDWRSGNVVNRGQRNGQNSGYGGNAGNANKNPPRGPPKAGRVFMMQRDEAEADDTVITGTFPVYSVPAYVLFDSGASHSFISATFSRRVEETPAGKLYEPSE
ncbi:uncharacterized protein LOC125493834 [Beta vulgaris subsp. vulgaris]|uniref:uncharacterized protein LOC125493834 n=1 Tax=Beta vulgaris subsp. vulgaris TaxID=3555 RepID=UPI002036A6A3|nr:uncharacterized protein LOC125493834 [Beta vulgaris subsp. vulgaris]